MVGTTVAMKLHPICRFVIILITQALFFMLAVRNLVIELPDHDLRSNQPIPEGQVGETDTPQ
ncbi:hypothetical protein C0J52_23495 [Blattella germanica]|nr:hypothetical protein C0J52_23495 [Blattella germanica]